MQAPPQGGHGAPGYPGQTPGYPPGYGAPRPPPAKKRNWVFVILAVFGLFAVLGMGSCVACVILLPDVESNGTTQKGKASGGEPQIAAIGVAGTLKAAQERASKRAAEKSTSLTATLSGVDELCVGIAWQSPSTSYRALFVRLSGPHAVLKAVRLDAGPTGGVCIKPEGSALPKGRYSVGVSQGPSIADVAAQVMPEFIVVVE